MVPQMTYIQLRTPLQQPPRTPKAAGQRLAVRPAAAASIKTAPAPTVAPPTQASPTPSHGLPDWSALADLAGIDFLNGFTLRPNGVPSTAPNPTLPTSPDVVSTAPVLLYRDTNAWCPFCERVWLALEHKRIPYDTILIDLRDKPGTWLSIDPISPPEAHATHPEWYKAMVPTTLVPAARINGELVYESKDILMVR